MKEIFKWFVVILFLQNFSIYNAAAQTKFYREFPLIKDIYTAWQTRSTFANTDCETLYYTQTVEPVIIDSTIKIISAIKVFKVDELYVSDANENELVLTDEEQKYILAKLEKVKNFKWPNRLLPEAKMVKESKIAEVFNSFLQIKPDEKRAACSIIYTFSKPIFLRDSTLCLFLEQERYRINATQLEYSFYKKQENDWQKFAPVFIHYESIEE